jgi:hypothetical protein
MLGSGGTFRRWGPVGGSEVTGGVALKGTVGSQSLLFLSLLPSYHEVSSLLLHLLPTMMVCLLGSKGQGQSTMDLNVWSCEPKSVFSPF